MGVIARHRQILSPQRWLPLLSGCRLDRKTVTVARLTTHAATRHPSQHQHAVPWLMLSTPSQPEYRYFYELSAVDDDNSPPIRRKKVVHLPEIAGHICFGASQGYLFTIPPAKEAGKLCNDFEICAINPLTRRRLPLPSVKLLPPDTRIPPLPEYSRLFCGKALLSPCLTTLFLLRDGLLSIAEIWRAPRESQWIPHGFRFGSTKDCAWYKGRLYAVGCFGELLILDPGNPMGQPIFSELDTPTENGNHDQMKKYLVVSPAGEDLFLVCRRAVHTVDFIDEYPWRSNFFRVFKLLDEGNGKYCWDPVKCLRNLTLFVGANHSVSYYASDDRFARVLKPNCIYFTDDYRSAFQLRECIGGAIHTGGDMGVYSLDDRRTKYYEMGDEDLIFDWPFPVWLVPVGAE